MWIPRPGLAREVNASLKHFRVTSLLGPRQCGKTSLARRVAGNRRAHYFDLERSKDFDALASAEDVLSPLKGLVVIDEVQRRPELFKVLRVLADRKPLPARFLILGSAAPELVKGASETLAGRISFIFMGGLTLRETGGGQLRRLWARGGFPESFNAASDAVSLEWRESFISTFVERDIPQLELRIPSVMLRRFWAMVAHYHGQMWNASEIASSMGLSYHTARRYLDLLTGTFVLRQLPPYHANVGKRLVKAPKVYVRDSGILQALLGVNNFLGLMRNPKYGPSWEGFAMEEVLRITGERHAFYWRTADGAELDLLLEHNGQRWGFEFKASETVGMTKSMHSVLRDLEPQKIFVLHPGKESYVLHEKVQVLPLSNLSKALSQMNK